MRSNKKKSAAELLAENRVLRQARVTDGLATILITAIKWGCALGVVRYISVMVVALAGETTTANIAMKILGNFSISQALAWSLSAGSAGYGLAQNKLRKDTVERLQSRIRELEESCDPRRSSSRLTPRGDTRPEDKT
jgi:hypothetical protein